MTVGLADHRGIVAQLTVADTEETAAVLVRAVCGLLTADLPKPHPVDLPSRPAWSWRA